MDQAASLEGREGAAIFLDCRSGELELLPLGLAARGLALVVIDSGTRHRLADGAYANRRDACRRAAARLGVAALRDASIDDLGLLGDATLERRARHVLTEEQRVLDAALADLGPLLNASHASLRDDFEVSTPELDAIVDAAVAGGALGARVMGGGFGGSAIALAPEDALAPLEHAVLDALEGLPAAARAGASSGSTVRAHQPRVERVRPAAGARRLA